ncbi:Fe-S cluster assembly scaffold SufA [Bacterioplanes sanyensis]|uniref:HesB/IscA family protein n=1 Tax=Bacterioplanes sanyensis TaxID=1249553 RepID=UPI001673BA42|nr:iron-sulfur cluster assembly accessory protein [Bacterioplanes sanyensis]GGY33622.1 Fe-S cluster assembly scaffold SufA [Bacterioplanes sanyensis]
MSIETFDPSTQAQPDNTQVSMTEAAINHVRKQLAKQADKQGVRLGVKKSGCSGFKYDIEFVDQPQEGDLSIQVADDLTLFVAADAAQFVQGTEIDFSKEGLNSTIKFNNPNAKDLCGCGESFSV